MSVSVDESWLLATPTGNGWVVTGFLQNLSGGTVVWEFFPTLVPGATFGAVYSASQFVSVGQPIQVSSNIAVLGINAAANGGSSVKLPSYSTSFGISITSN
jgi:hypothetical protein